MRSTSLRLLAFALVAGFAWACGGSDESETPAAPTPAPAEGSAAPAPSPAPAPAEEELRYTGEMHSGEEFTAQMGGEVGVPSDFPEDVPQYPGATPSASIAAGSQGMMVIFSSSDDQEKVFNYYKDGLSSSGWAIENEASFGQQRLIDAVKDDRRASIGFSIVDGATQVSVAISPKDSTPGR